MTDSNAQRESERGRQTDRKKQWHLQERETETKVEYTLGRMKKERERKRRGSYRGRYNGDGGKEMGRGKRWMKE